MTPRRLGRIRLAPWLLALSVLLCGAGLLLVIDREPAGRASGIAPPDPGPEPEDAGGNGGSRKERPHPVPPLPRHPRRGPHGDPLPLPPPRVRPVTARARETEPR